jgi:hypothetical protein
LRQRCTPDLNKELAFAILPPGNVFLPVLAPRIEEQYDLA